MKISEAHYRCNKEWDKENTEKLSLQYNKALNARAKIRAWADAEGLSMSAFVLEAVTEKAKRDGLTMDE